TFDVWVDQISHRVIGRALDAPRKKVVVTFAKDALKADGDTVPDWIADPKNEAYLAGELAALALDGPHFQLR
ncbi:MAG: hypothetical protein ACRCZP_10260, partial [Phycicoccus sp.]